MLTPSRLNYFVGVQGAGVGLHDGGFEQFVRDNTYYVGKHTNILVPHPERFDWLRYMGSRQSRSYFTHLLLATVARAKFVDNQRLPEGRLPRLIEPFVGPGQVFLNAIHLDRTITPLFDSVVAGDLNHYLVGVYRGLQEIGDGFWRSYRDLAEQWDANMEDNYAGLVDELNRGGRAALRNHASDPVAARSAVYMYIWLVNRGSRGTKLNTRGGLSASLYRKSPERAQRIRDREISALQNVQQLLQRIGLNVEVRDFRGTSGLATPQDIVFMDPPFSRFSTRVPRADQANPEQFGTTGVDHYGIAGETEVAFQTRVVEEARRLVQQGTTVILHNNANPGLIRAYARLIGDILSPAQRRQYIYTYRSPLSLSEAYQLTIVPGRGNAAVARSPDEIFNTWLSVGGDNYRTAEFFEQRRHPTAADHRYQQWFTQQEWLRRDADPDYEYDSPEDDEEDSDDFDSEEDDTTSVPEIEYMDVDESDADTTMLGPDEEYVDESDELDEAPPPPAAEVAGWRPPRRGERGPGNLKQFLQSMKGRRGYPAEITLDQGFSRLEPWLQTGVKAWALSLAWDPDPDGFLYTWEEAPPCPATWSPAAQLVSGGGRLLRRCRGRRRMCRGGGPARTGETRRRCGSTWKR